MMMMMMMMMLCPRPETTHHSRQPDFGQKIQAISRV
jgi:hypothetical protein